MYNFVDVNEALEENVLPSEALKLNGVYIEDQISGYRTLNVSGREALSPDVVSFETGIRDGTKLKSKRYPERIIVVTYQLVAGSNEEFREAYNQLGRILDVKDAELIFNDEQDKYFVGTPCTIGSVPPGRNAVVGEIEFLCTDPFKYSVVEYEASSIDEENSVLISYNGTYKSFPRLEAAFYDEKEVADDGETAKALTGAGDCGYVAFFNEDKKIIQLGDPEEVDGESPYAKSQTLINQTFLSETAWGTTAKALWAVNNGNIMASNVQQIGSVAMKAASITTTSTSGLTSGTLLAKAGVNPRYQAVYSTKNRTANSVDIVVSVSATVGSLSSAGINSSTMLTAFVTVSGTSYTLALKNMGTAWNSNCTYSASKTIRVSGLTAATKLLVGNTLRVAVLEGTNESAALATTNCNNIIISEYTSAAYASYYLAPSAYGTVTGKWHGPTISRAIGADASGAVGATDFTLTYKQKMCISQSNGANQVGSFRMNLTDASGKNIAGIWIYKNKSGQTGNLVFYVGGKQVNTTPIDIHHNNAFFGSSEKAVATTTVTKSGGTITFAVGSYKRQFTDSTLASVAARKVTFSFEKYSDLASLEYNGLYWAKFVKNNCTTYKDIPNKFSANDVVIADCKNAEIYLNGIQTPNLGALGNDWEGFYLTPGINQIGFGYSEWVQSQYAPKITVRYREVFL